MKNSQGTILWNQNASTRAEGYIPLNAPVFCGNEKLYLEECIDSTFVSSAGKFVDLFESQIADYTGAKHAISCVNGTCALQMSMRLAGVRQGDEVILPTLTFIAPVNAVAYNDAEPVFMDVDEYYNLDAEKTIDFIKNETEFGVNGSQFSFNRKTGKRIKAIVPVHVWGNAASLDELTSLCEEKNIAMLEDACESLGTFYSVGKFSGRHSGTIGKLACLSFNGNKIITTGGGGMILTDDDEFAHKARYLSTQAKNDPERYVHNEIGYNFRLTNIQAALGVAQLEMLKEHLVRKREIFSLYQEALRNIEGLDLAEVPDYAYNNHWMNILQIDKEVYGKNLDDLLRQFDENNIETRPVWGLNHLQKPYSNCLSYRIEKAPELAEKSLCLPSSVNLDNCQISKVIETLSK